MQIYKFDTSNMRVQMWSYKLGDVKLGCLKISFTTKNALENVKPILDNVNNYKMKFYILDTSTKSINYTTGLYWDTNKPINSDEYQNIYFVSSSVYPSTYTISNWNNAEFYAIWE